MKLPRPVLTALVLLLSACADGADAPRADPAADSSASRPSASAPVVPVATLVDSSVPESWTEDARWGFRRDASADLDGDGQPERIALRARAEVRNGRPLWDDGQPWEVSIEAPDGRRTRVFARFVQLGTLEAHLSRAADGKPPVLVLLERTPNALVVREVRYRGPGDASVAERLNLPLDPAAFSGTAT